MHLDVCPLRSTSACLCFTHWVGSGERSDEPNGHGPLPHGAYVQETDGRQWGVHIARHYKHGHSPVITIRSDPQAQAFAFRRAVPARTPPTLDGASAQLHGQTTPSTCLPFTLPLRGQRGCPGGRTEHEHGAPVTHREYVRDVSATYQHINPHTPEIKGDIKTVQHGKVLGIGCCFSYF